VAQCKLCSKTGFQIVGLFFPFRLGICGASGHWLVQKLLPRNRLADVSARFHRLETEEFTDTHSQPSSREQLFCLASGSGAFFSFFSSTTCSIDLFNFTEHLFDRFV
jgi:hypothetical protein